jgi:hypothetical protein
VQECPQPPPAPTSHAGPARTGAPPTAAEACPSVAPSGEADRISVPTIALAFLCSSAGSTFASPAGNHSTPTKGHTAGATVMSGGHRIGVGPFVSCRMLAGVSLITWSAVLCAYQAMIRLMRNRAAVSPHRLPAPVSASQTREPMVAN